MGNRMNYDFLDCVKNMPPLSHARTGKEFDINDSEAARWIANQPSVLQKIFDMARYQKVIQYDPETGTWEGVEYGK